MTIEQHMACCRFQRKCFGLCRYMRKMRASVVERTIQLREEEARSRDRSREQPRPYNRKKDYYATLMLDRSCSAAEVRRAFRRLSLRCHPDKQLGRSDRERAVAAAQFEELKEAHAVGSPCICPCSPPCLPLPCPPPPAQMSGCSYPCFPRLISTLRTPLLLPPQVLSHEETRLEYDQLYGVQELLRSDIKHNFEDVEEAQPCRQ